ncbi:MAG: nucleotidyltransferase domain-containing protein [Methermicoccaceae archaeon]
MAHKRPTSRIRDFLITCDGLVFSVVDYVPQEYYGGGEGIRAMLRYIPDEQGERRRGGTAYTKLDTAQAFSYMREHHPDWVFDVFAVPESEVCEHLKADEMLERVAAHDFKLSALVEWLEGCGIPKESMGITGSRLTGLATEHSDIDFVVYGEQWWNARRALEELSCDDPVRTLDEVMWRRIYEKRKPHTSFDEFVLHEQRKHNRGVVGDTYFDLLYVRDYEGVSEYAPPRTTRRVGMRTLTAEVVGDKYAFDAPAIYEIDHPDVSMVVSYTHTYAGQAFKGEVLEARGMLEKTPDGFQLVVGTTREAVGEWIRSLTLLERRALGY